MKVEVEKRSETVRAFHIEVPEDVVSKELEGALLNTQRRAKIPGFRPGKAPKSIIEQKFGKDIESDVVQKLIPDFYMKAVKESGLTPVEMPQIEKMEVKKGAPLAFTAVVEVKPAIEAVTWQGVEVADEKIEVSDEEIQKTLTHLQDRHSQLEAYPEDHLLEKDDFAILDYEGFEGDLPVPSSKNEGVLIQIGSGRLIPGFEDGLIGARKGDFRELKITFPEDYHAKEMASKEVDFKVKVGEIKKKVSPALDDDFAREVGNEYNSLEDLRSKVRREIQEHKTEDRQNRLREAAVGFLVDRNPVTAPQAMVERELERLLVRAINHFGKEIEHLTDDEKRQLVSEYTPIAERNVKASLLLEGVAKSEKIDVTQEEVDAEMERLAEKTHQTLDKVKQHFSSKEGTLQGLKNQIQEWKTLDLVLSKAQYKEPILQE